MAEALASAVVVKDRVGRRRYILFEVPDQRPSRRAFSGDLPEPAWKLTVYTDELGILRVPHTEVEEARAYLEGIGAPTVTTSGTIRAAKEKGGLR
jgi:RNase P/RNase MRP subunit POP5